MQSLIVDQSDWGHIVVTGEDRIRFIQGMCSANIDALAEGSWIRATMLNVKGRVMSVFDVINRGEDLLLHCESGLRDKTIELLEKHAIVDDVEFERVELPVHRVWPTPAAVWDAPPILAPPSGPVADAGDVEIRRIEAGLPRYGVDVTMENFPFESTLARHVDYEKGCYLGQEPVYRVHSKGQASKALRGLAVEGDGPVSVGETVHHPDRDDAGTVTSAVMSPEFGSIALAYLHRTVWEPGGHVTVNGRPAVVVELPFRVAG